MYYGWLTAIILFCFPFRSTGQNSFSIRFTPNMIVAPSVDNPSSALIYGEQRLAFDAGLDYSHSLNKNFSITTGLNIGLVDFNKILIAPVDAFGNGSGQGKIFYNSSHDDFLYTGLLLAPNYRFKIQRSTFHLSAGPNIRLYHSPPEPDISRYAFNRSTPWNPDTDPADFELNIPSTRGKISTDITTSFTIERNVSARTKLLLGLRYNLGLKPVSDGTMYVNLYNQRYDGRFAVRSNYIGLDLQLRYLTKMPPSGYDRLPPVASDNQDFRRAIFIELLGSSPLLSLNYDMRLKRHHNDGLGFRAGFGLGSLVESDYIKTPRYFSIPIGVNYIVGPKTHGFEAGIGYTAQFLTSTPSDAWKPRSLARLNLGYRLQPLNDGFLFRSYWSPNFSKKEFFPGWAGVSFGYSFR